MSGELDTVQVPCPTCGAPAGVPCTVRRRRLGPSTTRHGQEHLSRFDRYFRRLDRRKPDGGAR